ncbi:NAD(P)-dependent oxidoreductase [Jiella avicenniae]|uniref:NAD(P)-dependent oxidoreductase n=1 Tax=Jiella avicenniae TaxID=2907202 RepID=A0A9X1P5E7_9HYPH|nr:NAD(P)-dependent oxidoreductase [Jiella avicenniae]MCE7030605.1 NAD(P)-dependent oxidoreductase [Jiella avicenniae]
MKIALIGASGNAGSRILKELSDRGHAITAIARGPARIASLPGVVSMAADINDTAGLTDAIAGHDVVVSALRFAQTDAPALIAAVKAARPERYLVVGGAGSLEVGPGMRLVDTPDFPDAYKPEALGGVAFLDLLRAEPELDWTFLSPSAAFVPGERTGRFRLGGDELLVGDEGSSISFEDFAVALADEIEAPAHRRQRFTVGY